MSAEEGGTALFGPAENARRLSEIRSILAGFDWEHDDLQYALEQIEMIAEGGQP